MSIDALSAMSQILAGLIIAMVIEFRYMKRGWIDALIEIHGENPVPEVDIVGIATKGRSPLWVMGVGLGLTVAWLASGREAPNWIATIIVTSIFYGILHVVAMPVLRGGLEGVERVVAKLDKQRDFPQEKRYLRLRWWRVGAILASLCITWIIAVVMIWI